MVGALTATLSTDLAFHHSVNSDLASDTLLQGHLYHQHHMLASAKP
jgi:hypothetical protein